MFGAKSRLNTAGEHVELILLILASPVIILIIWIKYRAGQKRKAAIAKWLADHNWQTLPDDTIFHKTWRGFPMSLSLGGGLSREILCGAIARCDDHTGTNAGITQDAAVPGPAVAH